MLTLCLGGELDGRLVNDDREWFHLAIPIPGHLIRKEHYRREIFGWGNLCMWVYLHEYLSDRVAMDMLFGTRASSTEPEVQK